MRQDYGEWSAILWKETSEMVLISLKQESFLDKVDRFQVVLVAFGSQCRLYVMDKAL